MIWYSDEITQSLEIRGDWIDCVKYIHGKWQTRKDDISIFLKLAVTAWYTLTLDGPELSLTKNEYEFLEKSLCETYHYFLEKLGQEENCQWLFGYMMEVRADLFLLTGLEYDAIEQKGKQLIAKSSESGNIVANLLFASDNQMKKAVRKTQKKIKEQISEYFDEANEVDKYFIEMLTT